MILPEEYLFLNEGDNTYKPTSILNSDKNNNRISSQLFENQGQFIDERLDADSNENSKQNFKSTFNDGQQKDQKNLPKRQMNNFTNFSNQGEFKNQNPQFDLSPQQKEGQFQKLGELSMISFDSQDEVNHLEQGGEDIFQSNEGAVVGGRSGFRFFQDQNNQFGEDDESSQRNQDIIYSSNGFPKKKKKKRKQSEQRREQTQRKYETIQKIYAKEMGQSTANGWFQASSTKMIQESVMNSTQKNNKVNLQQQQKPFSAQRSGSNIKFASLTNGFSNVDNQQKSKQLRIEDDKGRLQEQQSTETFNKQRMKPPQSANLTGIKNIQKVRNYKDMIIQRPYTRQNDFPQQNSTNSYQTSHINQTPKIQGFQFQNISLNNQTDRLFNQQQDDFMEQGSTDAGFSFQNVFQLAGKDFLISPRSNTQELNGFEQKDNDFDQLLLDHHVYISSSVTNQHSNYPIISTKNEQEEKKIPLFGKTLTSLQRPFSKENTNRKDALKNIQQNIKSNKKEEVADSANKVVTKNKKRTIFKINNNPQPALYKEKSLNGTNQISQQNSVIQNSDDLMKDSTQNGVTIDQQSPINNRNISDKNSVTNENLLQSAEREIPQKENLPAFKVQHQQNNINSNLAKKNNYFKQDTTSIPSTIQNFSNTSSKISSLQATVAANRNVVSANRNTSKSKSSTVNPQETNMYSYPANQIPNNNQLELSDNKNKKKSKINTSSASTTAALTNQNNLIQRVFCMNSQDEYIRRTLLRMGWRENKLPQSTTFDLKWIYIDSNDDYKLLAENQYYNHFKNNTELTQKGRLLYNLKNNTQFGVNQEQFFPRCYDLGNDAERQEFSNEYNRINIMVLLKKHIQYIKLRRQSAYQEIKKAYQIKQNNKLNAQVQNGVMFGKRQRQKFVSPLLYEDQKRDPKFLVNTTVIAEVIELLRKMRTQQEEYIDETRQSMEFKPLINQSSAFKLNSMIQQYVKINVPFDEEKFLFEKIIGMSKEYWQTPSHKLMTQLYSLYKFFKDADPQFKVSGTKNIWIIKPSANSRGSGIYLVDKLDEAIDSGLKMQARIVQKYIERPLIFVGEKYKKLNNKKFDIRQWVLVTSFKPLKIYFFTSSYLRICSQSFDLDNIKNLSKHLTNFSINKNNITKESWDETVVELKDFITYLKDFKNIDYQEDVKPQIKGLIIETIKCAADKIVNRKNSFEMYGFDILLDEYAHPWLLEVNLSPACSERTPFLTDMLDAMAYKMFQIVFKTNTNSNDNLQDDQELNKGDPSAPPSCQNPDYEWEDIYNEEQNEDFQCDDNQPNIAINNDLQLIVVGQKADIKKERNLDKRYFQYWQYLAKKQLIHLREMKHSIIIQKNFRMFYAKKMLKNLKEQKASIKIQSMWRRKMCINKLVCLKKNRIITKLQVLYKIKKAKKQLYQLKINKAATKIQSKFRQFKAKKLLKNKKYFKKCVIKIQKFYKQRYNQKVRSSNKIRAFYKMKMNSRLYALMKRRHYSAIKIQSNYKRFKAQQLRDKLRLCSIARKIYFHSKKYLLSELTQKIKIYPFAKRFTQILHEKLKLVCIRKIYNIGLIRVKAAIRIQGLLKIKKAKRFKKRLYRLKLLIKLQVIQIHNSITSFQLFYIQIKRRVKVYLQRLKFLRQMQKRKISASKIFYFLKICVAKAKLLQLRYLNTQQNQRLINRFENYDLHNWDSKNSLSSSRPQTQQSKSRSKMQRPPSQVQQRNISSSNSTRREAAAQQSQEMYQTKNGGFNYFNYLKDTQSRQNQVKTTQTQKQLIQQHQQVPQQLQSQLKRHNSQNLLINQKCQQADEYKIHQIMKNYTHEEEDSPTYNQTSKVGSSKSTYNIKPTMNNLKQQNQQLILNRKIPNSLQQDNFLKSHKNNAPLQNNFKKFRLDQEVIKDIEQSMNKLQNNQKQGNQHQISSTFTNFQRF